MLFETIENCRGIPEWINKYSNKAADYLLRLLYNPHPKSIILVYHRVGHTETDPQLLSVSPKYFEDQVRYLKNNYNVISLQNLIKTLLLKQKVQERSVVITFDDGYADNYIFAKDILEKYGLPATFFVTKEIIGLTSPRLLVKNWDINTFQDSLNRLFLGQNTIFSYAWAFVYSLYIARKTLNKELLPQLSKHIKSTLIANSLRSILFINRFENIGGSSKVANILHKTMIKRGLISNMLVEHSSSDDNNTHILLRDDSKKQRYLYFAQELLGWQDFFHLSSFKIRDLDIFKSSDIVHLHSLVGNYFSLFALPQITALKPVIWTLHDRSSTTGHCVLALYEKHSVAGNSTDVVDCDRWETGCGQCPGLASYPAVKRDATKFIFDIKKRIYDNSYFTAVCVSNWLKKKAEKSILKEKDIRLIYNGVDTKIFFNTNKRKAKEELGFPQDKKVLLFCSAQGKTDPWKGSRYLEDILKMLTNREKFIFVSVGAKSYKNENNTNIEIPYIRDEKMLAKYYSAADIFIYPSLADSLPLVVLESLSCGTPVITFDTGGIAEIVQHGKTGYVAEQKNLKDFIKGLDLFTENEDLYRQACVLARKSVEDRFSIDEMANNYISLYNEVLEVRKNGVIGM